MYGNIVVGDQAACQQKAADADASFYTFDETRGFCFYSATCNDPLTATIQPWKRYQVPSGALKSLRAQCDPLTFDGDDKVLVIEVNFDPLGTGSNCHNALASPGGGTCGRNQWKFSGTRYLVHTKEKGLKIKSNAIFETQRPHEAAGQISLLLSTTAYTLLSVVNSPVYDLAVYDLAGIPCCLSLQTIRLM